MKLVFNLADTFAFFKGIEIDDGEQVSQLIIPDFYMGLPVEVVYVDKTKWCDTFVDIVIGNNVKAVQNTSARIFGGTTLKRIYLGKSLRSVLALTSSGAQIGENITYIYYHPDCPIAIPTQNGAGNLIAHHKGSLDIKYQLTGDHINKKPLIPYGLATEKYVDDKLKNILPTGGEGVGITSIEQIVKSEEDSGTNTVEITLSDGQKFTFDIKNGGKGSTPVKGTDYFTEEDKAELVNSVLEALPMWEGGSY